MGLEAASGLLAFPGEFAGASLKPLRGVRAA